MTNVEPQVIEMDTLRFSPTAILFKGARFSGTQATSFIVATPPGGGVGLHIAGLGIQSIRTPVRSPLAKAGLVGLTEAGISKHLKLLPLHHSEHTVGATSYPADSVHATRPRFSAVHGQTQGGCIFRTPQPT